MKKHEQLDKEVISRGKNGYMSYLFMIPTIKIVGFYTRNQKNIIYQN